MRILKRADFLAMPSGTVFMKFPEQPADGSHIDLGYDGVIAIKGDTVGEDFIIQDLFPWFEGTNDSEEWADSLVAMLKGAESPPLDYESDGRDGLFDRGQLFLVWSKDDLGRMIKRLQEAFDAPL